MNRLVDYLKLALSDEREMTDSAYETLSVILHEHQLADCAYDSGLVQMIDLLDRKGITFPVSLKYLKNTWELENVSFQFLKMLASLVKEGLLSLRKVKSDTVITSQNITLEQGEGPDSTGVYITVYATDRMKGLVSQFNQVFHPSEEITEGGKFWDGKDKKLADAINKAKAQIKKSLNITMQEESYTKDADGHGGDRLNLLFSGTSKYTCRDSDIQRLAKKYLGKSRCFMGVEAYMESDSEVFVGLDLNPGMTGDFKDLVSGLYNLFDDLEVNNA